MKIWSVQDAKARFSELLETCLREGPQVVSKRGTEAAVLVPVDDWRRLQRSARPTLKELLLADEPRAEFPLPVRGRRRRRPAGRDGLKPLLVSPRHQRRLGVAAAAAHGAVVAWLHGVSDSDIHLSAVHDRRAANRH